MNIGSIRLILPGDALSAALETRSIIVCGYSNLISAMAMLDY
jgi:hypothetical protein